MPLPFRLLPASLTHRVFALYAVTLLLFVGLGTGTYLVRELDHLVEQPQAASVMLIEVTAQAIQDSVVIGDYDTVARTLDKGVQAPCSPAHRSSTCRVAGSRPRAAQGLGVTHRSGSTTGWLAACTM